MHLQIQDWQSNKTVWPSGLRRRLKAPFRKGVGSNPTAVIFAARSFAQHAKSWLLLSPFYPRFIPALSQERKSSFIFYWRSHVAPYVYPCCRCAYEARGIRAHNLLIWSQTRCRCAIAPCFDMHRPLSTACRRKAQDAMWAQSCHSA